MSSTGLVALVSLLLFAAFFCGAAVHESDIAKELARDGKCGSACWLTEVKCP